MSVDVVHFAAFPLAFLSKIDGDKKKMDRRNVLLNKKSELIFKKNSFVLHGVVIEINDNGVFFQTETKTSFICWDDIGQLITEE
jgi:hypothetical protein